MCFLLLPVFHQTPILFCARHRGQQRAALDTQVSRPNPAIKVFPEGVTRAAHGTQCMVLGTGCGRHEHGRYSHQHRASSLAVWHAEGV